MGLGVELRAQPLVEDRCETGLQELAAGHPLVVAPCAVVVRTAEAAAETALDSSQERLVVGMHAERDLRLAAVAAEVALSDEKPDTDADIEVARGDIQSCFT